MDSRTVLMIPILALLPPVVACGSYSESPGGRTHLLPWEMIVGKFHEGGSFCRNDGSTGNKVPLGGRAAPDGGSSRFGLCFKPGDTIVVGLPADFEAGGFSKGIDAYRQGKAGVRSLQSYHADV